MRLGIGTTLLIAATLAAGLPVGAQNVQNGAQLYNGVCVACHGNPPIGGPENAANQPSVISSAISRVAAMRFIQLSAAEIADIAAYIAFVLNPPTDPPPIVPTLNYTALWFDPAQSGWGINVTQHSPSNKIFSLFYLYENPNKPMWISLPDGTWTTPTTYTGKIYRVSGPPPTGAYDTTKVNIVEVGTATLSFTSATAGTLSYTINGTTVTRAITRFAF